MPSDPTADFLTGLHQSGLLPPANLAELRVWAAASKAGPGELAKEVQRCGWLTNYQIKEVYRGRGAGLKIGPYILLDLLGEGGMGRVFKAHHTRLERDVALKVIRKERLANPLVVRRFHQEIQAVAQLSHPNVVLAFDAGEEAGTHYFAMEYIDGTDLTRLVLSRGPLPVAEACEYVRQSAVGLHHAFEKGLVHRDVKPSNLLVAKSGGVKVLDLGLALLNEANDDQNRVTQDGYVIGTPDFVAPEQARNPQAVDTRADVYALGCTLFYTLTGKVPFEAGTPAEKLIRHCVDPPPSLRKHKPELPEHLDAVVQWMMAKRPADRPQTPLIAAAALQPFCPPRTGTHTLPVPAVPTFAPPPPSEERSSQLFKVDDAPARVRERHVRQVNWLTWAVALVALTVVGVGGFLLYKQSALDSSPPEPFTIDKANIRLVRLTGGTFVMGSPDGELDRMADEGPAGEVTVGGPFFLSATEITHAQYIAVVGSSPATHAGRATAKVGADMPVESVSWYEAVEFCKRLTEFDRGRRAGWAYRLPTEAEWEYACRAGTTTAFWCGEAAFPNDQAVYTPAGDNPFRDVKLPTTPAKVGQTKANPFGLFDTHGNVGEWVGDWYARGYPPGPRTNPTGPADGDLRVVRGGAFTDPMGRCRSAARRGLLADRREPTVGFRVAFARVAGGP